MDITVALDSPRRRDLEFYEGDDVTLNITVYALDGDTEALTVTDPYIEYGVNTSTQDAGVEFSAAFCWRTPYKALGTIDGKRVTLAHGLITSPSRVECSCGFYDYGLWVCGPQPAIN